MKIPIFCPDCHSMHFLGECPQADCDHEILQSGCPRCEREMRDSALAAGIPLSVIEGHTKLSDHFSAEYIAWKAGKGGEE